MVFKLRIKKRVVIGTGVLGLLLLIWPVIRASSASSSVPKGLDRPPEFNEVRYSPEDGDRTATNPPAFVWLPVDEINRFDGPPVHRPDPPSTERRTMSPGEWQQNAPDEIMTQIEAEFVPAKGGAAVRIGDDLILIRARDAEWVTAAGTQTTKDFEVWKNYY